VLSAKTLERLASESSGRFGNRSAISRQKKTSRPPALRMGARIRLWKLKAVPVEIFEYRMDRNRRADREISIECSSETYNRVAGARNGTEAGAGRALAGNCRTAVGKFSLGAGHRSRRNCRRQRRMENSRSGLIPARAPAAEIFREPMCGPLLERRFGHGAKIQNVRLRS